MDTPLEREIKIRVPDRFTYERVRAVLGLPIADIRQENHFFDTFDNRLRATGSALRVRIERSSQGERAELTLKGPTSRVGALTTRAEYTVIISMQTAREIVRNPQILSSVGLDPANRAREIAGATGWREIATFTNHRLTMNLDLGDGVAPLELDHTLYPNASEDFEIEFENASAELLTRAERALRELLARVQIPWEPQTKSKIQRALERAGAILERDV